MLVDKLYNSWYHTLRLCDLETGECLRTLKGHTAEVNFVAISPDGRFALSGSKDNTLRLWDIKTGECLRTFGPLWERSTQSITGRYPFWTKGEIDSVAISPDGRFVLLGSTEVLRISFVEYSWDYTLHLWDIKTGAYLRTLKGHTGSISSVAFSPDGRFALSGSLDNTLRLWDIKTGECLRTLEGHTPVAISPDGRFVLSGSRDNTLRLWNIKTGGCLRTLGGHKSSVSCVTFSPDGKIALSGDGFPDYTSWVFG